MPRSASAFRSGTSAFLQESLGNLDDGTVLTVISSGLVITAVPAGAAPVPGTAVTYTTDADFDQGVLVNVNHDAPNNNQLQLNRTTGTFPFIWVALSQRCTIAKVNTETGAILGEYRTVSDGTPCGESSRTTVSLDGSVWVGHRGTPRVTHVGLVELNECVDRNNNGTIETSTGYGDVKAWPGVGASVSAAGDECILHHISYTGRDSRHMSIDSDGNLWVGDRDGGNVFRKYDGATGALLAGPYDFQCGGYGGLIDGNGVIWSADSQGSLLRYDTTQPVDVTNPRCIAVPNYGLAIDSQGNVWVSTAFQGTVRKFRPDGTLIGSFPQGVATAQGLAVDNNDHVWISSSLHCVADCTVSHLRNDGSLVGLVPTPTGSGSTGVSVDADGKVWTANRNSHTAVRIDPAAGPVVGGTPLGAVDLTVSFPAGPGGRPLPFPYNYSDMTGSQLLNTTAPQGTWTVVQDGGASGTNWGKATWNTEPQGNVPAGASITVEARAADTEAGLGSQPYQVVANGAPFAPTLVGRYVQIRVTLRPNQAGESPVLSDITIETANKPPVFDTPPTPACGSTLTVNNGVATSFTVQASDPDAGQTLTLTGTGVPAGAAMTPPLPASGNPVSSAFSLTPGPADEGTHVMTFTVTDPFGASATCTITIRVVALVMTGRATLVQARASALGITVVNAVAQDTGDVATRTPLVRHVGVDVAPPPIGGSLLASTVNAQVGSSDAASRAAHLTVGLPLIPTIEARGLLATSHTDCAGSSGDAEVAFLRIGATTVPVPVNPAPNTVINLPLGLRVVVNEQVPVPGGLRVNAIHITSPAFDVVLASATSDIHNCV